MKILEVIVTLDDNTIEIVKVTIPAEVPTQQVPQQVAKAVLEISQIGVMRREGDTFTLIPGHRVKFIEAAIPSIDIYSPNSGPRGPLVTL
jgi:hypothetical protein